MTNDSIPIFVAIVSALGMIVIALVNVGSSLFRHRSEGVFVKPSVLKDLQQRGDDLSERLDEESVRRRALEVQAHEAKGRISSLEHNETMNARRMEEMEIAHGILKEDLRQKDIYIQELLAGIDKLIAQALRNDLKPDWRPGNNG